MSLKLVLGSSGAGKTKYLYDDIIKKSIDNPSKNYILIVPEQFTMETQKDIVELHPRHGVMNIDILSFNRLAFRIFEELGINRLSILDDTGKTFVLRHVIEENKDKLEVFEDKVKYFGFVSQMKSSISELYQYGISPDKLSEVIEKSGTHKNTSMKLKDIQLIYSEFQNYVNRMNGAEGAYITKEEVLSKLCEVIDKSEIIKNSEIYLDGFTGFTPVQNRLIKLLMRLTNVVNITLTISEDEARGITNTGFLNIKDHELFAMSKETANTLMAMCADERVQVDSPVIVGLSEQSRHGKNPVLATVEKNLFRYDIDEKMTLSEEDSVSIYCADNPMYEAKFVAESISQMIMESKGQLKYRDIAVVTGDLEGMKRNIERAFNNSAIPHFMDNKRSLIRNPFVNVIRSILEIVDDNFSYESVFSYLKNDMSVLCVEETDVLENYVLGCGIKGKKAYSNPFTKKYKGLRDDEFDLCENIRAKFMEQVGDFFNENLKKMSVLEISNAIRAFVEKHQFEEMLSRKGEEFKESGLHSLAAEYSQAYKLVMELLEKLDGLLGDEKLTLKEYRRLLDDGFQEIKVGIIPMVIDQVVVGDIQRTRLNHVKVLFVMGVNDGIIPSRGGKPGLLSGNDRTVLKNLEMELSPDMREQGFIQKFYLYLNLTKPTDKLIMTYSKSGSDGNGLRPSYLIGTIRDMFENCQVKSASEALETNIMSTKSAFDKVVSEIKYYGDESLGKMFAELFTYFAKNPEYKQGLERAIEGAFYLNDQSELDKTVAKALYGENLGSSITRLEKYAACAYAHFLSYGLKLVERPVYEIKAADMGNIFHQAIELFSKIITEKGMNFREITEEQRKSMVDQVVDQVTKEYGGQVFSSSARNNYLVEKVRRVTDRSAWAILEHIKRGSFEPTDFELKLREGRIDRADKFSDESDIYVKIIDYKSGSTAFDPVQVENGLQLQLIYYMDSALKRERAIYPGKNVEPGGAFYFNIKDPMLDFEESLLDDDERASKLLAEYKMTGALNSKKQVVEAIDNNIAVSGKASDIVKAKYSDAEIDMKIETSSGIMSTENFENLIRRVKEKVSDMTAEILDGNIDINPYKKGQYAPCNYCKFKHICAFDNKQFANKYKKLGVSSVKEIQDKWNTAGKED